MAFRNCAVDNLLLSLHFAKRWTASASAPIAHSELNGAAAMGACLSLQPRN